jgi:pimeloyl-ACP methyl ester carboxylesterase
MIDFLGHGNSQGMQTTMGYAESEQVKMAYKYVKAHDTGKVIVFGSSMGAVAALRAVAKDSIQPDMLLLEAPFGSMLQATKNRFAMLDVPSFPISQLTVFWGGLQEGYWGFANQPIQYAKQVDMPVLLMYGVKDRKVTLKETQAIFANLKTQKQLHLFANSGHEDFCVTEPEEFAATVRLFWKRSHWLGVTGCIVIKPIIN